MAKHILPPDESELPPPKIPWNKNVSMSMVATTTYIPYSGEAQATSSSSDTFILHNFREFLFLYPFDNMETAVDIMRFTHIPICHDFRVPMLPVQPTNLVVVLASCDILVSPIAAAKWVQQSHTEFAVAHENGAIYVYDHTFQDESSYDSMDIEQPEAEFTLLKQREDRTNPVACWHVSSQAIYDLAFSPNGKYMACVGKTGALTVFQYHMQRYDNNLDVVPLTPSATAWLDVGRLP
ncbi:hypothetical protein DYB32_005026 [Aphanomyces invadans]|uniref:Anaphase-promoting complex subunit 4 WD40 domain-containing protein n=1 Tax=Aphanomyces invadans TaxID=157072 RepID=A0A3R6VX50_9STRA|nr:hypothetical protein DYB32_005026 [Aphanomyces invadans]